MQIRGKWWAIGIGVLLILPATAAILNSLPSRSAAIRTERLAAAAATQRSFSPGQRLAVTAEIQNELHPHWKDLSFSQSLQRYAMFAKVLLRPRDVATPAAAAFVGNQTMISDLSSDLIALDRQSDCSLTLHKGMYTISSTLNPTLQFNSVTANYQGVLHAASGVKTTGDAFAHGCVDPGIGTGTRRGVYLGTVQGKRFVAWEGYSHSQGKNALYYSLVDPVSTAVQNSSADYSLPNLQAITAGDLNGDGIADVVGIDLQSGTIDVWLAHADGTLSPGAPYSLPGTTTEAAVIADVNGDGKLDVVVATRDGAPSGQEHISVLTGKGDGTLNAPQSFDVPTPTGGQNNASMAIANLIAADVRGSGHPDIIGSNGLLLLNGGTGTFSVGTAAFPAGSASSSLGPNLAAGDFNNDGKLDVAVSNGADVRIFLGSGTGSFSAGPRYASTSAVGYLAATDIDGDGNTDLYLGLANGGVFTGDQFEPGQGYVLMGNGDGTFQGAPSLPFSYSGTNLADLDGDGNIDAVGVNADGSFGAYLGNGKGVFAPGPTLNVASVSISGSTYSTGALDSYALGDVNGDGKQDLAFISEGFLGPNGGPGVFIANGDGHGGFAPPVFYAVPSTQGQISSLFKISNLHLADLNKDGKADLIYNYADSSYSASSNSTTLYFGTVVQLSNGDGTFQAPQAMLYRSAQYDPNGSNPGQTSLVALVSDLNKDGKPDLVFVAQSPNIDFTLSTYSAGLQVALGHGDGTFAAPVAVAGPDILTASYFSSAPASVAVADMNGDGIPDLVALGSSTGYAAQVAIALGVGDGTFKAPSKTTYAAQYLNTGQGLAVGDFNGDGKADVAITDPYSSLGAGISLGNGDGTLQTAGSASLVVPSLSINVQADGGAIAYDFNGDGVADILAGNTLLLSQAGGVQTPPPAAADFSLGASAASGSVAAGQAAQVTLTVTPSGGFAQSVSLACSGLPAGAACSFSPSSVSVNGAAATSTLTISTTARSAMNGLPAGSPWLPGGTLLAGLMLPMAWRRRRTLRNAIGLATLASVMILGACHRHDDSGGASTGGSGGSTSGTPAGAATITITATAGATTHSVSYQLTVS